MKICPTIVLAEKKLVTIVNIYVCELHSKDRLYRYFRFRYVNEN